MDRDKYARDNQEWVRERFEMIKNMTKGSYVNFPISELKNYDKEYFGGHAQRLKQVNQKYDPFNVFRFPQGLK